MKLNTFVAPAVVSKPTEAKKLNAFLGNPPQLKALEADTVSFGANVPSTVGLRSGQMGYGFLGSPKQDVAMGGASGGTSTRTGLVDLNYGTLTSRAIDKVGTPQDPDKLVQIFANTAKSTIDTHGYPAPMTASLPVQSNDKGVIVSAANLGTLYTDYPFVQKLSDAIGYDKYRLTKGFRPVLINDMTAQLLGSDESVLIAIGTGAGNGVNYKGKEFGHATYTKRGEYPLFYAADGNVMTYEKALCDLPFLLQHEIVSISQDPKADPQLREQADKVLGDRNLRKHPFTMEDWLKLHDEKSVFTRRVVNEWKVTLTDFTTGFLLANMPEEPKIGFSGTRIEKLLPPNELQEIAENVSQHPVLKGVYPTLTTMFSFYDAEKSEVLGTAKRAISIMDAREMPFIHRMLGSLLERR
jgi:hypothetical protein